MRRRRLVIATWLVLVTIGALGGARLSPLLSNTFTVPGTESDRVARILDARFHDRSDGNFLVVVPASPPGEATRLHRALVRAAALVPTAHASAPVRLPSGDVVATLETRLPLARAKGYTALIRGDLTGVRPAPVYLTGAAPLQHDLDPVLAGDLHHGEYGIALPIAFVVLLAVIGLSWIVSLPLLVAAATIELSLGVVYLAAHWLSVASYVTNLVELIGLGLAVDYSLLVVARFRQELRHESEVEDAVVATMLTAGRTVIFAATSVALGLALLLLIPIPFIRSLGLGGLLIPLSSVAATLTLMPALLATFGRAGSRRYGLGPRFGPVVGRLAFASKMWRRARAASLAHPVPTLIATAAVLLAAATPVLWLRLTPGSLDTIPRFPQSVAGFRELASRDGAGTLYPTQILLDAGPSRSVRAPAIALATDRLVRSLAHDPEVAGVEPSRPIESSGRYRELIVAGRDAYGSAQARRFVTRARQRLIPAARFPSGVSALVGGGPAQGADFLASAYRIFPWLVAAVLACTYILLVRAFRSLLLPLKAVVLNVLSVTASYGVLVAFFQWGIGHTLFGLYRTQQIEGWIPIFLFAILFGLSMDYEVFLVSRMREERDHGLSTEGAIRAGLSHNGPVVTAAAAIMIAAFSGFVAGRIGDLQQFGIGLAAAVFIDATLVRLLLVPSLMQLFGEWNWWLPGRRSRVAGLRSLPGGTSGRS